MVAAKLFRQRSYKGTKMDDIAEALHIKGASLYNHIKSKDEILNALLIQNAKAFDQRMKDIRQADVDPLQQLELVISLHIELTLQNPDAMALMLHDWVHLSKDHKPHYIEMRDQYEQHFKAILQASIDRGQIVGMDLNLMMFLILSQLRSLYAWCTKYKDFNRIELENSVKTSILKGILKK